MRLTLCEAPTRETRPDHNTTLLLIVIFFLTVVNLIGDSHTKEVYIFRLWGVIEMHWLNYSVPKSLLNEILQKYQEYTHVKSWKVLFS